MGQLIFLHETWANIHNKVPRMRKATEEGCATYHRIART